MHTVKYLDQINHRYIARIDIFIVERLLGIESVGGAWLHLATANSVANKSHDSNTVFLQVKTCKILKMSFWNVLEEDVVCGRTSSVATINRLIVKTTTKEKFDKYQHLFQMSSPLETKSQFESDEITIPAFTNGNNMGMRQRHQRTRMKKPSYIGHGVVIALVNMICTAYGKSPEDQQRLSKDLCETLVVLKVLSPNLHIDDQSAVSRFFQRKVMGYIYAHCSDETDAGSVVPFKNYLQQKKFVELSHYIKTSLQQKICLDFELDPVIGHWSRLDRDFEAIEVIGEGGFSTVVKAKNKLDGNFYAIKKIIVPVTEADEIQKGIDEIRILAKLSHPNIVRYKHAWVSSVISVNDGNVDDGSDSDSTSSSSDQDTDEVESVSAARPLLVRSVSHNSPFWASKSQTDYSKESKSDESDYGAVVPRRTPMKLPVNVFDKSAQLEVCIMMDLCNCTLQKWFDKHKMCDRLKSDQLKIFRQILEGIAFIHENDIIHRDLKPENIFIECDTLEVKIGDFGLACPDVCGKNLIVNNNGEFTSREHTQGIGTMGYISPEQKNGNMYDHKSDMYSIGVIVSELFLFYSKNEQAKAIQSLHEGDDRLFAEHLQKFPKEVEIIKKLLSKDPVNRPEAQHILEHNPLFCSKPDISFYNTSDGQSAYSSDYVASLFTTISERDNEIVALKSKMAKMEIILQNCVCHSKIS